nr:BTAD domain-containing putative transcriptional regulator [Kibdelosporangium sp. MJ126-NF4]CEL21363.1 Signal transduction response regulator / Disease resistance domain-containing protein [Kibdelosporangium sp. MJ126-NF4]CTQ96070.1 Signal transduction response regulator / Disease resistance domain-containing protein [Kibdelosporangium sp. MJ126-NF4]
MRIGMLGPLEVQDDDGAEIPVPGARLRTLLAVLALEPGTTVPVSRIVDAVWGARPPHRPGNAVQALVSRLRRTGIAVEARANGYVLAVDTDTDTFERLVGRERWGEALELWRGPALADVRDQEYFAAAVARLEEMRFTALRQDGSVAELTALVAENPLREELVHALMRALVSGGRTADALALYARTRAALAEQLGADPSPELSALHARILRGAVEHRTNLRAALTSFVGRTADVVEIRDLIRDHRLVTLTGPGGCGKTRLAVEAVRALPGEVWLVELAGLTDADEVPAAVLTTLGIRDLAALRGRELLVVLDNCEHLVDRVAHLTDTLLGECPALRVLATSREPLGITGEVVRLVEPLDLPPADARLADSVSYPAVRLLIDRASPGFVASEAVVRICRALDGIPLAIELAAARLRTMPAEQVAARLDDRFRVLTHGSRTALPRHQTLRAVIDWSWDLLSEQERTVLCRLAVFAGGATLEAAEAVCGPESVLTALVDKSLVIAGERYRMLDTIKAYCLEKLTDHDAAHRAHAEYFIALAESVDPHLRRAEQVEWLPRIHAEDDNINAALRNATEARIGIRLTAAASWYWLFEWSLRCRMVPGAELGARALSLPGEVDDESRATALAAVAQFNLLGNGDEDLASRWLDTARRLGGRHPIVQVAAADPLQSDDPWVRSMARLFQSQGATNSGRPDEDGLRAALAGFRSIGERWGIAHCLAGIADLTAWRGDLAAAVAGCEEAIAVTEEIVSSQDTWKPRLRLAQLLWLHGDRHRSADALHTAERDASRIGLPEAVIAAASTRAEIARWSGDFDAALVSLARAESALDGRTVNWGFRAALLDLRGYLTGDRRDAMAWARRARSAPLIAQVLIGQADQALRAGDVAAAARLLAESVAVRGAPDLSNPDAARIQAALSEHPELSDPYA